MWDRIIVSISSKKQIMSSLSLSKLKRRTTTEQKGKQNKKIDRFNGLTEEEVQRNTLPDILDENLDMVFVGINPSLMAAHKGRYYAGPGNHFYKLLFESKLTPRLFDYDEDRKLLEYGIGLTNIVERPTRSSSDLKRTEIKEGAKIIREKLMFFKPRIAIFNGKGIYEVYSNKTSKSEFNFGLQPEKIGVTAVWVVPSSSARCAHFPRMVDKLHFYSALRKYLHHLRGEIMEVDEKEFLFEGKCKQSVPTTSKMWRRKNMSAFLYGGRVANKDTVLLDTSEENIATVNSTEFIVESSDAVTNSEGTISKEVVDRRSDTTNLVTNNTEELRSGIREDENDLQRSRSDVSNKDSEVSSEISTSQERIVADRSGLSKPRAPKFRERRPTADFVSLIKKRLVEKDDAQRSDSKINCTDKPRSETDRTKNTTKLKYANLKTRRSHFE